MSLSDSRLRAIEIAEKVASTLSFIGAALVIITFSLNKNFRKPINRLVFYASFGNLFANVATIISRSGLRIGVNSGLCQFQAFLIQWFMPADALWTFAMACNVWLTFFHQYDAQALRRLEWKYICFCYGLPFIPALVYLFLRTTEHGRVYGSAVLWCWVSEDWNALRIATFYGPVWLFIITNIFIYIKVGIVVFKWRKQLLSLNQRTSEAYRTPANGIDEEQTQLRTYEVQIHSQVPHDSDRSKRTSYQRAQFENELKSPTTPTHTRGNSSQGRARDFPARQTTVVHHPSRLDANKATISYCYTAMLFFVALLVTWVPSTVNRLYTLIRPHSASPFGLDFASGLVLPLQGLWNCVIYFFTSQIAVRSLFRDIMDSCVRTPSSDASSFELAKPGRRKQGSQPLGSTDTRADIVISLHGKERVVHHRSQDSVVSSGDEVPEMVSPSHTARHKAFEQPNRHSSISDSTTAAGSAGYGLSHSHSQRSFKHSERSSSRGSNHIVDQMDMERHQRIGSDGSYRTYRQQKGQAF